MKEMNSVKGGQTNMFVYESPKCETTELQIEGAILQNSFEDPEDRGSYPW